MCAGQSNLGDMCIFHHIPNPMHTSPENGCSQQAFNVTWPGDSEIITLYLGPISYDPSGVCASAPHGGRRGFIQKKTSLHHFLVQSDWPLPFTHAAEAAPRAEVLLWNQGSDLGNI